jgi:hypothetical protein
MQRAGTLRYMGPPRPVPLLNRPRGDKCSKQGKPSQANRGPKNLGRSGLLKQVLTGFILKVVQRGSIEGDA